MYPYLVGILILFVVWGILFLTRKDLRKPMVWTGILYTLLLTLGFFAWWIISQFMYAGLPLIPYYWNPETLFNLGRITGGLAIEDILFMFFVGGIATSLYEFAFGKRIKIKRSYKPHLRVLIISGAIAFIFVLTETFHNISLIYLLIIPSLVGAFVLWFERKDLFKHSLIGAVIFLVIYSFAFQFFNILFPNFIHDFYTLHNLSGIILYGLPLEEYFYAFSFGLMWAPLYEYAHGEKDTKSK
jgi:hypothetical protein